jgi:hypothetical protein
MFSVKYLLALVRRHLSAEKSLKIQRSETDCALRRLTVAVFGEI